MGKNLISFTKNKLIHLEDLIEENPLAAKLYLFLSRHADDKNVVVASDAVLVQAMKRTRSRTTNALRCLKEKGFISIINSGISKVIILNPFILSNSVFDSDYPDIEILNGVILLSKEEQELKAKVKFSDEFFNQKK
jgi:hypothetical protein